MTTLTNPASPKQIAYIGALAEKVYGENAPEAVLAWVETEPTTKDASAEIDRLIALIKAPKPAADKVVVPNGIHMIDGTIVRIRTSKSSGSQYAERLLTQAERTADSGPWAYEGRKGMKGASEATVLTLEKAKMYGVAYGVCAVCGALLTDIDSIEAGIGPVCAKKF